MTGNIVHNNNLLNHVPQMSGLRAMQVDVAKLAVIQWRRKRQVRSAPNELRAGSAGGCLCPEQFVLDVAKTVYPRGGGASNGNRLSAFRSALPAPRLHE